MSALPDQYEITAEIDPTETHTHTAIVLHDRGETGQQAIEHPGPRDPSAAQGISEMLLSWRWVYPTAPSRWCPDLREHTTTWCDATPANNDAEDSGLSRCEIHAIRRSVLYIRELFKEETVRLGNRTRCVILGGEGEGSAIALYVFMGLALESRNAGGFFGVNAWLPLASKFSHSLSYSRWSLTDPYAHRDNTLRGWHTDDVHRQRVLMKALANCPYMLVLLCRNTDAEVIPFEYQRIIMEAANVLSAYEMPFFSREHIWYFEQRAAEDIFEFMDRLSRPAVDALQRDG